MNHVSRAIAGVNVLHGNASEITSLLPLRKASLAPGAAVNRGLRFKVLWKFLRNKL
jgi:hypothetical protein